MTLTLKQLLRRQLENQPVTHQELVEKERKIADTLYQMSAEDKRIKDLDYFKELQANVENSRRLIKNMPAYSGGSPSVTGVGHKEQQNPMAGGQVQMEEDIGFQGVGLRPKEDIANAAYPGPVPAPQPTGPQVSVQQPHGNIRPDIQANPRQQQQLDREYREDVRRESLKRDTPYSMRQAGPQGYREQVTTVREELPLQDPIDEELKVLHDVVLELANRHFGKAASQVVEFDKEWSDVLNQIRETPVKKSFGISYLEKGFGLSTLRKAADGYYISGYVSSISKDRDGDIIDVPAQKMMEQAINGGMALFLNHEHGMGDTIGRFTQAKFDGKGLWAEAKLENPETNPNVKSLLSKLESGIPLGFSIGGDMLGATHKKFEEDGSQVRVINGVKLYEVSVVGLPSNQDAMITGFR